MFPDRYEGAVVCGVVGRLNSHGSSPYACKVKRGISGHSSNSTISLEERSLTSKRKAS